MLGLDFFVGDGIIYEIEANTKSAAVEALVRKLSEQGHTRPQNVDTIVKALMKREELGSTGLGRGVAVPHAKHEVI